MIVLIAKAFMNNTISLNHTDTLLLGEIMRVYRKVIQDNFQIPINFFSNHRITFQFNVENK